MVSDTLDCHLTNCPKYMKNLLCENPTIILNRHAKDLILKYGNYTIRNQFYTLDYYQRSIWSYDFPYKKFGTRVLDIKSEDIDSSYITDFDNGELIPLYIELPCNKCVLCREKKARDWSTRAMCESQTSDSYPLFITLTYNEQHLPSNGVNIQHCQNFMKRLRINVERRFGESHLRFFLCSEYGSKTARPHYHLLLWNFPSHRFDNLKQAYDVIEKSWSYVVRKSDISQYDKNELFYDLKSKRYRVRYGFVHVQMAQGGHVKYCMKYMRKDSSIPKGCEDTFYLASRKRGIGYEWYRQHKDEILNNPHYNNVEFTDVWSCAKYKAALPQYFKTLMYPTPSAILPKEVRDKFGEYVYLINVRNAMIKKRIVYTPELRIFAKFSPLYAYITDVALQDYVNPYIIELDEDYAYYEEIRIDDYLVDVHRVSVPSPDSSDEKINIIFKRVANRINELEKFLQSYDYSPSEYESNQLLKNHHHYWLSKEIEAQSEINVSDRKASILRTWSRRKHSEIF